MANLHGETKFDPIDVDTMPDPVNWTTLDRYSQSGRRHVRSPKPLPNNAVVITISDDESPSNKGGSLEGRRASSVRGPAQSIHRNNRVDPKVVSGQPTDPDAESNHPVRNVTSTPSTKPHQSHLLIEQSDNSSPAALVGSESYGNSDGKVLEDENDIQPHKSPLDPARKIPTPQSEAHTSYTSQQGAQISSQQPSPGIPTTFARSDQQKYAHVSLSTGSSTYVRSMPASAPFVQNETVATHRPVNPSPASIAHTPVLVRDATKDRSVELQNLDLQHGDSGSVNSPIGGLAGHGREQTTSDRVNKTTASERAVIAPGATERLDSVSSMHTKDSKTQGTSVPNFRRKQRAVKSVKRPDDDSRTIFPIEIRPPVKKVDHLPPSRQVFEASPNGPKRFGRAPCRGQSDQATGNLDEVIGINSLERSNTRATANRVSSTSTPHTEQFGAPLGSRDIEGRTSANVTAFAIPHHIPTARTDFGTEIAPKLTVSSTSIESNLQMGVPKPSKIGNIREDLGMEAQCIGADDLNAARTAVEDCLRLQLINRHKTHAYLTENMMKDQRRCQERRIRAQHHQRKDLVPSVLPERYVQPVSPFEGMSSIEVPFDKKSINTALKDISQEIFTKAKPKDIAIRSAWVAPMTTYRSEAIKIPPFKEYVSLKNNILADNVSKLLATPYIQDGYFKDRDKLLKQLPCHYELKHDENALLDLRLEQCRFYKDTVESLLREIDISWDEILFWLLAAKTTIININNKSTGSDQFERLLCERSHYHNEDFVRDEVAKKAVLFDRTSSIWQDLLSQLQEPSPRQLRLSAITCATLLKECNLSIWYLAQQSELVRKHISTKAKGPTPISHFTFGKVVCIVCHQHNCLFHGELREAPEQIGESHHEDNATEELGTEDSEDQTDSEEAKTFPHDAHSHHDQMRTDRDVDVVPAHFDDDSDIEKIINYKVLTNPFSNIETDSDVAPSKGHKPPDGPFNSNWWLQNSNAHSWDRRKPFFPCNHEGSCDQAKCRCYKEKINCEKSCRCSRSCNRRFPGCNCAETPGKRVCAQKMSCLCHKFNRECDADLCSTCGATEILDPVNRYNEDALQGRCCNVAIQRSVPKKTLLGHSEVHGFGLYVGEDIAKDEYIGEYLGETISIKEGDRRMAIYEYQQTMYSFKLNTQQEVDATFMGNKLRFINNASKKHTNCYSKNLLCNSVFRLALYASIDIKAGTELFFDYNYPKEQTAKFKQPKSKDNKIVEKQALKRKGKSKSASPSRLAQPVKDRSRVFAATAKARAARAEKHAARLAAQAAQELTNARRTEPQQARKTAPDRHTSRDQRSRVLQLRNTGMRTARRLGSRDDSDATDLGMETDDSGLTRPRSAKSRWARDAATNQVVEDTEDDAKDEDDILEESRGTRDIVDIQNYDKEQKIIKASEDVTLRRKPIRLRQMPKGGITSLSKKGVQHGADRLPKRKRSIVFNSDDE
ncbi:hypothetical protein BKA66DRAFT_570839 [Pyrenochaeta sp. MPI-SDFR-AT-0127]|nr:hypothetical protein BKA66DRAFT_570839 [Pyrenochaeta sp. MPI-SDFR-AT-0127]